MSEGKKKLAIRRETLRELSSAQLGQAVGGGGIVLNGGNKTLCNILKASLGGDCGMGIKV